MTPLLSICIPSYNRAETLQSCLSTLCVQVARRPEPIELLVCDNASTDETATVVHEAQVTWPFVRYTRNETNIGLVRNIDRAVRHATGRFCWLFGDDDVAMPYALDRIMEMVAAAGAADEPFAFACVNAFSVDAASGAILATGDPTCRIDSRVFRRGGEIFAHVDYPSLGHMSRLVVARALWLEQEYDAREDYEIYSFIRVLIRMSARGHTRWLSDPLLAWRNKHSPSYYTNHMPMAYTIEFPEFDRLCLTELGLERKLLRPMMRLRRSRTVRGALKMLVFQEEYAPYLDHLADGRFSLRSERVAVGTLHFLLRRLALGRVLRSALERRETNPVAVDRSLHSSV